MRRLLRQPIVVVPIAIVVTIVAVWWLAFRPGGATASADTTKQVVDVTSGPMSDTVSAEGTVAAAQTDDLSFASSGTVTAVNVKAGDTVQAGQVLATIDSAELAAAVTAAEASVAGAEAKLSDDQAAGASAQQLAADQSSLTSANDSLTNAKDALAGASLVATFDGTVASVTITPGEQLSSGGTGGTSSAGSGSGSGRSAGSIGSANGNGPGAATGTGSSAASSSSAQIQVVSSGRFTVELAVDTADIDRVAVGQTATVTPSTSSASRRFGGFAGGFAGRGLNGVGSTGQGSGAANSSGANGAPSNQSGAATSTASATGTVTDVGKIADASSGVATYPVTISFDSTGNEFYVGSTVTGAIATDVRANVVQVSSLAITTTNGVSTVTVATDGTTTGPTETRAVTTGLVANGSTEITSGLKAGEKVIVTITRPSGAGGFSPPAGGIQGGGFPGGVTFGPGSGG